MSTSVGVAVSDQHMHPSVRMAHHLSNDHEAKMDFAMEALQAAHVSAPVVDDDDRPSSSAPLKRQRELDTSSTTLLHIAADTTDHSTQRRRIDRSRIFAPS